MEISKSLLQFSTSCSEKSHQWPQIFAIFVVSLGAFTCGVQFAWTSPSIPILISNSSHMDPITMEQASYLAIVPAIGTGVTAPLIGILMESAGRKNAVIFMTVSHFFSWLMIAVSGNICLFYVSRFLSGIGIAVLFSVIPIYVGEVTDPYVRGLWGNLITVATFFGHLMVNIIGTYWDIRTTAFIFGCVPVVNMLFLFLLPESPYFLLMKKREEEARRSLKKLRWMENVDKELFALRNDVQRQISESGTLKDLFISQTNQRALVICIAARVIQQFSGLPAFALYTQYMFNQAGGNLSASTSAIIYSGMWTLVSAVSSYTAGQFGRRPLMMFSCMGCGIILIIEATYFYIEQETGLDVSKFSWLPLTGMLTYVVVCSVGLAILPVLFLGELFSASIKGKALTFTNICFAFVSLIVPKIFQYLTSNFGLYLPFYVFSFCCFAGLVFSYYYVIETKDKTLEEIQQALKDISGGNEVFVDFGFKFSVVVNIYSLITFKLCF